MDDLIRRQDAIDKMDGWKQENLYYHPHSKCKNIPFDEVIARLEEVPSAQQWIPCEKKMPKLELTKGEAYSVAEFIDFNLFTAIRDEVDWDSMRALRNLIHVYEKCCILSGYFGCTDTKPGEDDDG